MRRLTMTTTALVGAMGWGVSGARAQLSLDWSTIDGGGATMAGGSYSLSGTTGQFDAAPPATGGTAAVAPGFWPGIGEPCYANCDGSTAAPVLNVLDFNCFINRYTAGEAYANCDGSTTAPVLNVLDFNCFINRYTEGCP
jgi:hypothetical protein